MSKYPKPGTWEFNQLTPGLKSWARKFHTGQWAGKEEMEPDPRYQGLVPGSAEWRSEVARKAYETRRRNEEQAMREAEQKGIRFTRPRRSS
ncbi:MAG: hypothetical protein AB1714_07320 [Acidobacteriota bacterium]